MRKIDSIVIHHTAVDQSNMIKLITSIDKSHKLRWLHKTKNALWYHIAYHYIIWVNWEVTQTRLHSEIWFHASNLTINSKSIWIALSGNMDNHAPAKNQMDALMVLILELNKIFWKTLDIRYHNEFAKKTCPGKKFPYVLFDKQMTMASKFKEIFLKEVTDPIFSVQDDPEKCTIADAKYLMEIWIARSLKRLYTYVDEENRKDRSFINKILSFLKLK